MPEAATCPALSVLTRLAPVDAPQCHVSGDKPKAAAAGKAGDSGGLEQKCCADPVQHSQQCDTAETKHLENTPHPSKEKHMLLTQKASPYDKSSTVNPACAEVGPEKQHLIEHTQGCPVPRPALKNEHLHVKTQTTSC